LASKDPVITNATFVFIVSIIYDLLSKILSKRSRSRFPAKSKPAIEIKNKMTPITTLQIIIP